ncbi:MAG: hypothetical protein MZU91_01575 [Desulfosudis oleivorans]|nr:hypothetical protein [Desulfosudis oleivorans]
MDRISFDVRKGEILGLLGPERRRQDHHPAHADRLPEADLRQHPRGGL